MAIEVFDDPFCFTQPERIVGYEQRFWAIGRMYNLVLAVVVHTIPEDIDEPVIHLISARKATPQERRLYEEADR